MFLLPELCVLRLYEHPPALLFLPCLLCAQRRDESLWTRFHGMPTGHGLSHSILCPSIADIR